MIEQLINLGKQQLSSTLMQKESLNQNQVDSTFDVAQGSFIEGLKQQVLSGNISQMTDLFNGKGGDTSSLQQSIMNVFVPQLASKLGISSSQAGSIATIVVPFLISKFTGKETGTAGNSNDLLSMLGMDSGSLLGGLGKSLGGLFG